MFVFLAVILMAVSTFAQGSVKVAAKFYNKRTTFEVDRSIADMQARSAFSSPEQLNAFVSMLFGGIDKSINLKVEALSERVINNMIAQTLAAEFPSVVNNNYSGMTGVKAVNLLYTYNQQFSKSLTAAACLYDEDFLKWAAMMIRRYVVRMSKMSSRFNIGGLPRFTPSVHSITNLYLCLTLSRFLTSREAARIIHSHLHRRSPLRSSCPQAQRRLSLLPALSVLSSTMTHAVSAAMKEGLTLTITLRLISQTTSTSSLLTTTETQTRTLLFSM